MGKGAKARAKAVSKAAARKRLEEDEIEDEQRKQIKQEREQEQAAGSADTGHSVLSATNVGSTSPSKKAKIEHVETIPIHSDDEDMDIPDAQD